MNMNFDVAPPSIEFKGLLGLTVSHSNSEQIDIFEVIHCDGLLLCTTKNNISVVWNPCLGEARRIQLKAGYKDSSQFGIGYQPNKSGRSYKILRFWPYRDNNDNRVYESFEIYELRSDSWRVLDDVSFDYDTRPRQEVGTVSLKGNTYWVGAVKQYLHTPVLLCFDFTTERFKRPFPLPFPSGHAVLSPVREEELSVLNWDVSGSPTHITMWVTDRIETEAALSWSKSFKVDLDYTPHDLIFPSFKSCLYDEEKKMVLGSTCTVGFVSMTNKRNLYIIRADDKCYSEDEEYYTGKALWSCILNYVPSLVQIPFPSQGKTQEDN